MVAKSMQYSVCFGLAGSFAIALAPAVHAQVQVRGGNIGGQAAFFVPTPGTGAASSTGKVELFDVGINRLRLETSAGNTSTAIFVPTAASFSAGSDNKPNAGDTGTLKGNLSGIAFSGAGGTPIPFSNRQAILNFTLNSFTSNLGVVNGTLISPQQAGDAPLIFLPKVDATVGSGSSFQATRGDLQLGDFNADLKTGVIDLPSTVVFRDVSAGGTLPPAALIQRVKFSFEGENVRPGDGTDFRIGGNNNNSDDDDSDDNGSDDDDSNGNNLTGNNASTIRFVGQANKKFQIQTVGTSGSSEFKIQGNIAAVDIKLGGPFDIKKDDGLSRTGIVDKFKIEGESEGFGSLFSVNSLGFSGTARRDTKFSFEQDKNKLEGRTSGDVDFYVVAGASRFNRDTAFTNINSSTFSSTSGSRTTTSMCSICGNTLVNNSTILIGGTTVVIGAPIIVSTGSSGAGGGTGGGAGGSTGGTGGGAGGVGGSTGGAGGSAGGVGGSTGGSVGGVAGGGSTTTTGTANAINVNVFSMAQAFTSSTALFQYQILTTSNISSVTNINVSNTNISTRVRLVQKGGQRYYIVTRNDSGSSFITTSSGSQTQTGSSTTATGSSQTQTGGSTTATGSSQTQTGGSTTATGSSQTQTGGSTTATGSSQTQTGGSTTATSGSQTQTGSSTTATSGSQTQTGGSTTATGSSQTQTGSSTTATGSSTTSSSSNNRDDDDDDDNRNNTANNRNNRDDDDDDDDDDNRGNNTSTSSNQTAYQLVGPSSRCFPGLVGLKQIPASEVANINNENPGNTATTTNVNNNTTSSAQGVSQ